MNVEGVIFRAPTTTDDEHAVVFMDRPRRRNCEDTFDRTAFTAPERLPPERNSNGKVKRYKNGNY